ncbi:hypothetical protein M408DRAFT_330278 [Serendipita vermifera MAFF 305830]|uniref:FAD-binding domain-containing protein n=1 Tax=Serendipita vermifera MAFF 305830 TaxID=933852 RepID=A0A0C3B3W3_SERVB|nr:hypothetical protein M408DRAFT_330278 [Serendipita vermifera MAFF 305830]
MSTSNKKRRVICIGNGVAGPVFAMALQKLSDYEVILVDARSAEAKAIGGAISISPNGLKALEFVGADQIVTENGGMQESFRILQAASGDVLAEAETAQLLVSKYGYANYGIIRQVYCSGLRELARERGIDMRFNMRLESIQESDNAVTAHFDNGESLTGDLLVGCDGIHSPTRAYVVGEDIKPRFANVSLIIGLSKFTAEESTAISDGFNLHLGQGTNFGCYRADNEGTWAWFIGFATGDPAGGEAEWASQSHQDLTALALSKVEHWNAPLPSLIIPRSYRVSGVGLYDRTPIDTWHRGRVVLCGDAAHPVTPIGGQGSQIAIESAVILARLLAAEQEPSDALFQRYAQLRKPRTDAVVETGRRIISYSFKGGWRTTIRDFFVRILGGYFLRNGGLAQYDYDAGTAPL